MLQLARRGDIILLMLMIKPKALDKGCTTELVAD